MANPNTQINVGIRRNFSTLGDRNFEPDGTVQYASNREPLEFLGTSYHVGISLPFDVGGVSYSAAAIRDLQRYWDQGWITPLT